MQRRACLHAHFVYYLLSLLSGANANLAAQPLAWLLSGEAIAAEPTDTALAKPVTKLKHALYGYKHNST